MLAITKRIWRDRLMPLVAYSVGGIALVWLYIALLPTVQQSQVQMQEILKTMPEGLLKAFGMSGVDLGSLETLLAMKQYNMVWPLLLIFLVVSIAGGIIAGEIENRTIEITLAAPKSRAEVFLGKYLAGFIYMIIFVAATTLCTIPLAELHNCQYQAANYFTLFYLSLAFGWAVWGISIFLSSIFSSRGRVYSIFGIIYVVMYVLFIVTTLKESWKNLEYLSFFYYYNYNDALIHNHLGRLEMLVFLVVAIVFSLAGFIAFKKRDIAT